MSIFEKQITEVNQVTKEVLKSATIANYSLQNLEIFLQGLRVKFCMTKEDNPEGVIKVRRIHGLAHVDDGRLLAYPPKVQSFGAGPRDVLFYDSLEKMNKTHAKIDEAMRKMKGGGDTAKAGGTRGRAPTNEYTSVSRYVRDGRYTRQEDLSCITNTIIVYPVVNVGNEHRPVYLNPYFCWVIPGQVYSPKLSPELMDKMHKFAVRKPWENAKSIKDKGFGLVGLSSEKNPSLVRRLVSISQSSGMG